MSAPKRIAKSFEYAFDGFRTAFKEEPNMRIHTLAAVVVIAAGIYVNLGAIEWAIIAICIAGVFTAELFNTAIENLCDVVSPGQNEQIKIVKDISAAAVFCTSIGALIVAILIFVI
jgi:diacylglycerol kinase (ATP)